MIVNVGVGAGTEVLVGVGEGVTPGVAEGVDAPLPELVGVLLGAGTGSVYARISEASVYIPELQSDVPFESTARTLTRTAPVVVEPVFANKYVRKV